MKIISNFSPNFSKTARPKKNIKFVIMHYTGMQSEIESIRRLRNPKFNVSCHYLINRKGKTIQMVKDKNIAWHAGKSKWKNYKNLNKNSIGIELVNRGHKIKYENFTKIQIKKLIQLCLILKKKYKIKKNCILGHSDVAPLRKIDPGEKFPWLVLKKKGLAAWYPDLKFHMKNYEKKQIRNIFFSNLYKIGYRYFIKKKKTNRDKVIIKAFQRRFNQKKVNGIIDEKTFKISHFLANQSKLT